MIKYDPIIGLLVANVAVRNWSTSPSSPYFGVISSLSFPLDLALVRTELELKKQC